MRLKKQKTFYQNLEWARACSAPLLICQVLYSWVAAQVTSNNDPRIK